MKLGKRVRVKPGFCAVPNALLEALLASDLSHRQVRVYLGVFRLTHGYGWSSCYLGSVQIGKLTGLEPRAARAVLEELSGFNLLRFRVHGNGRRREIEPVVEPELWEIPRRKRGKAGPVCHVPHESKGVGTSQPGYPVRYDPTPGTLRPDSINISINKNNKRRLAAPEVLRRGNSADPRA